MKLGALKQYFKSYQKGSIEKVEQYLSTELVATLRELRTAFNRLRFVDNFECFLTELVIPATSELAIPNQLRGTIPSHYIIVKADEGALAVCQGDTEWTQQTLYLKNTHASLAANLSVIFFK